MPRSNYRVFEGRRGLVPRAAAPSAPIMKPAGLKGVPPDPITPTFTVGNWFNAHQSQVASVRRRAAARAERRRGHRHRRRATPAGHHPGVPALCNQWALIYATRASADTAGVGLKNSALARVQGFQGTIPATLRRQPGGALRSPAMRIVNARATVRTHLSDPQIFNFYDNLLTGVFDHRDQRFNASDFRYEQLLLGGKAGFEAAYNRQKFTRRRDFPIPTGSGNDEGIMVDVNAVLSVRSPSFPLGIPTQLRPAVHPPRTSSAIR
jgi:hypothetical protein